MKIGPAVWAPAMRHIHTQTDRHTELLTLMLTKAALLAGARGWSRNKRGRLRRDQPDAIVCWMLAGGKVHANTAIEALHRKC